MHCIRSPRGQSYESALLIETFGDSDGEAKEKHFSQNSQYQSADMETERLEALFD